MPKPKRDAGSYEPGRLRRAAVLACKRIGPRQYRVRGQHQPYYDVDLDGDQPCYCRDAEYRGLVCKHEMRARLAEGDPKLMLALGEMLLRQERRLKDSLRKRKASRPPQPTD